MNKTSDMIRYCRSFTEFGLLNLAVIKMLDFLVVNVGPGHLKQIYKNLRDVETSLPRSHFIGCGWYAIGMEDFSPEDGKFFTISNPCGYSACMARCHGKTGANVGGEGDLAFSGQLHGSQP